MIHSRQVIEALGLRITGPAVFWAEMAVEHVLLLNAKNSEKAHSND
jgi:hypothetical protein